MVKWKRVHDRIKCSWLASVVCCAHNACYKYYVVLTFHRPVLILAHKVVVACKKIYGHLIRIYFVPSSCILRIEYEDMKWPTNDPNRIPFYRLSIQFYPVFCCQPKLVFILLCHSTNVCRNYCLAWMNYYSGSVFYRLVTTKKMLVHPFDKT